MGTKRFALRKKGIGWMAKDAIDNGGAGRAAKGEIHSGHIEKTLCTSMHNVFIFEKGMKNKYCFLGWRVI